jgi:hypothetical protein
MCVDRMGFNAARETLLQRVMMPYDRPLSQ